MKELDYAKIGEQIRYIRKQQHISQEFLAEMCDISPSFMGHIERGTRKMSMETFVSIAKALHVSSDYLLRGQLPDSDDTISGIIETVKRNHEAKYDKYIEIIQALAEIADRL